MNQWLLTSVDGSDRWFDVCLRGHGYAYLGAVRKIEDNWLAFRLGNCLGEFSRPALAAESVFVAWANDRNKVQN